MKKLLLGAALGALLLITVSATFDNETKSELTKNFITGNPEIASINQLSFGPEGILFLGDSKSAAVFALDTEDVATNNAAEQIRMEEFDMKIATALGTSVEDIEITDMAVNPKSKAIYFAVQTTDGTPILLKLVGEAFENVSLKEVSYSKIDLKDPVAADAKDKRDRPLRTWAISELKYHNGKVLVSGLSNKEFGSTFRSMAFPFEDQQKQTTLEIYHAAHGKYETHAPIKTFDVVNMNDTDYLMASYTCTPLVLFPMNELKDGQHVKGRTVAELGAGNSPLDIISYEKGGSTYFLMSNSNRPVMRIKYEDVASFEKTLTEPVTVFGETEGVPYDNLPFPYVLQMDNLDAETVVYVQRTRDGDMVLLSRSTEWM